MNSLIWQSKDTLKIQMETVKIRQTSWKKSRRILPATKAARFYQLENKMDTEIDFVLAGGIPPVEEGQGCDKNA